MKLSSVYMDGEKRTHSNVEDLAERGRRRMQINEENKRQKQLEFIRSLQSNSNIKSPLVNKKEKFDNAFKKRSFPERYIYVIVDGQDLKSVTKPINFSYIEVNTRLCKLIP